MALKDSFKTTDEGWGGAPATLKDEGMGNGTPTTLKDEGMGNGAPATLKDEGMGNGAPAKTEPAMKANI